MHDKNYTGIGICDAESNFHSQVCVHKKWATQKRL